MYDPLPDWRFPRISYRVVPLQRETSSLYPLCTFSLPFCASFAQGAKILTREIWVRHTYACKILSASVKVCRNYSRKANFEQINITLSCKCMTAYNKQSLYAPSHQRRLLHDTWGAYTDGQTPAIATPRCAHKTLTSWMLTRTKISVRLSPTRYFPSETRIIGYWVGQEHLPRIWRTYQHDTITRFTATNATTHAETNRQASK